MNRGIVKLPYRDKKVTKDFFVVRAGQGDQCSVVQGQFSDRPTGAIGGAPYASKDYAEAALKKLPECKGGEASEFEGKKHGKNDGASASGTIRGSAIHF